MDYYYLIDPETGDETTTEIAQVCTATMEDALRVLMAPEGHADGRSVPKWVRMQDGTLLLAVVPHGDTYMWASEVSGT